MMGTTVQAAAFWASFLMLLLFVLSGTAAGRRRRHRIAIGTDGVQELAVAVRAFGNAAEYIPAGMAALVLLAVLNAPVPLIHTVGALMLAGRIIHSVGILYMPGLSLTRAIGMTLTWLSMLIAGVSLLVWSVI